MLIKDIDQTIARELSVKAFQVTAAIKLLDADNTVPFIARYRKEATGELQEEQLHAIKERLQYLRNLIKRQENIIESIAAQDKLTDQLRAAIERTVKLQELEDLYLPYKPKKRTRAQIAREKGLEPLAALILAQRDAGQTPLEQAAEFIDIERDVLDATAALNGALDIIAETIAERADIRAELRRRLLSGGTITAELTANDETAQPFLMYKDHKEPLKSIPAHRVLAINRGESKNALKVRVETDHAANIDAIKNRVITAPSNFAGCLGDAVADSYKRLLLPSLERDIRAMLTESAERQAIKVFGLNLKQLLLQPPLGGHTVLGLDPGYRTGCKLAVVDPTGAVLDHGVIYITHSQAQKDAAAQTVLKLIDKHKITLVSIGNGTASYETEEFVAALIAAHDLNLHYLITNEAGASVYSASKLAKEELPDYDVTIRGAVSIARRVQDPLAELVKIDPQSIGVGQYQHDVDQKQLAQALEQVIESAVNHVGVNLNTASVELLKHVAGVNATVAKNIVAYRTDNGGFASRRELLKVSRLGQAAFTQCAGFLRIDGGNPLDNTPVHPESYETAGRLLEQLGFTAATLSDSAGLTTLTGALANADLAALAAKLNAGLPTIRDIAAAIIKPGRDVRDSLPAPLTRKNIVKLSDIAVGTILRGAIQNVTDFGAFVDIGIKTAGLIHRSELSHKHFRHPLDVVAVGEIHDVMVISVDPERNRIGLSLKQARQATS